MKFLSCLWSKDSEHQKIINGAQIMDTLVEKSNGKTKKTGDVHGDVERKALKRRERNGGTER